MRDERESENFANRALQASCSAHVEYLDRMLHLSEIRDIRTLCTAVGILRERPIRIEALPLKPPQSGLWIAGAQRDYIFYARDASPLHCEHIVLHELAHLLRNHPPLLDEEAESLQLSWFPLVDIDAIREALDTALSRSRYGVVQEREAELLATLLEQRWRERRDERGAPANTDASLPALRWLRALEGADDQHEHDAHREHD